MRAKGSGGGEAGSAVKVHEAQQSPPRGGSMSDGDAPLPVLDASNDHAVEQWVLLVSLVVANTGQVRLDLQKCEEGQSSRMHELAYQHAATAQRLLTAQRGTIDCSSRGWSDPPLVRSALHHRP